MNLLYFEVENDMTWSLYMHETSVSIYHLTIGGIYKYQNYCPVVSGNLERENGRKWKFN